jgi:hypothetical protein
VEAPSAEVRQRVNWAAVNDAHKLEGFPDAGGFPSFAAVTSERPLALVRDLVFRVRAKGSEVPDGAATIEVALSPPGKVTAGDPLGTWVPPTTSASAPCLQGATMGGGRRCASAARPVGCDDVSRAPRELAALEPAVYADRRALLALRGRLSYRHRILR